MTSRISQGKRLQKHLNPKAIKAEFSAQLDDILEDFVMLGAFDAPFKKSGKGPNRPLEARLPQQIWWAALGELQLQVNKPDYRTWLEKTIGLSYQGEQFIVGVSNTFVADYLDKNQRPLIEKVLTGITHQEIKCRFQVLYRQREKAANRPFGMDFHPELKTQDVIVAYLTHMEDKGAANGYLTVRARKLRFFARQYPRLPYDPDVIHTYLRQFKTADVPTRQDQWKALSALYKFASGTYHVPNVMLKVDKPRFKKKTAQRLSRDQAKLLVSAVETDLEWALVTCYFGLRFRRVEAERLRVGDIKNDYLIVQGKERIEELPLLPLFRDKLLRLSDGHRPGDPLFPIKGDAMAYHVRQIFKRADIYGVRASPHTLRNSAGALWSTFGGDWTSNRQLLRHSEKTMTDHYSPLTIDELRAKDERHNPMLNLMRELGQASALATSLTNTTGVRETFADPEKRLPELLDQMIALGQMAQEFKHDVGGNGHWPDEIEEIERLIRAPG